jgi:hypothetical protein
MWAAIEQLQAVLHDTLAGFYSWGHGLGFNSKVSGRHFTTYRSRDKTQAILQILI